MSKLLMASFARRSGVLYALLAIGPALGAAVFLIVMRGEAALSTVSDGDLIAVPWHKSTRLMALEVKHVAPDSVDVLTRRDAKSGTTFVLRRIDCAAHQFQYLGEGATIDRARQGGATNPNKQPLVEYSIPYYVAAYACVH